MRASILKFLGSILLFFALISAIGNTNNEPWVTVWPLLLFFVATPFFFLSCFDLGKALRNLENPTPGTKILGFLFGLPQAMFGLISVLFGLAIIGWVLYNLLIERQEEFTGGFFTFGMGPAMVAFGIIWLRRAFKRDTKPVAKPNQNQ